MYLGDVDLPPTNALVPVEMPSGWSAVMSCCQPCIADDRIMHLVWAWDGSTGYELWLGYADNEDDYTSKDGSVTIDRTLLAFSTSCGFSHSLSIIDDVHYAIFTFVGAINGTDDYTKDSSVTGTPAGTNGSLIYTSTDDGDSWAFLVDMNTNGPPALNGQYVGNSELAVDGAHWWATICHPGSQNKVSGRYSSDGGATWSQASGINLSGQRLLWSSCNWGHIGGDYFHSFGEEVISGFRALLVTTTSDFGVNYDLVEEYTYPGAGMPTPPGDEGWQHTYANVGAADDVEVRRFYNSGQTVGVTSTTTAGATTDPAQWTVESGPLTAEGFQAPWVVLMHEKVAYLWDNKILGGVAGWMVGHTLYT